MSVYSRQHANPARPPPFGAWLTTVCVILVCGTAFWISGQNDAPVGVIGAVLGAPGHGPGCGTARFIWVGMVLLGAALLVGVVHALLPRALDLPLAFDTSWAGIGEDVETAGIVEPVLRLVVIAAVLLLGAGLVIIATRSGDDMSPVCKARQALKDPPAPDSQHAAESAKSVPSTEPPAAPTQPAIPAAGPDPAAIARALDRIATSLATPPAPLRPEDIRQALSDLITARLQAIETALAAIQAGLNARPPAGPLGAIDSSLHALVEEQHAAHAAREHAQGLTAPDLAGTNTALDSLTGAVQSLSREMHARDQPGPTHDGPLAPDLSSTELALKDIAGAIRSLSPSISVAPPSCPVRVEIVPPAPPRPAVPHLPPRHPPPAACQAPAKPP